LAVATANSLAPGTYALTITGTSAGVSHSANVSLVVNPPPDFSLAATPSSTSMIAGSTASFTVTVKSLSGFGGDVGLSLTGLSPSQGTTTFAPATVTGGAGVSTLTIATAASLPPGTYGVTITGASGGISHSVGVTVVVTQDFTLAISPSSLSLARGQSGSYTISVGSLGGFRGSVSFSISGLPSGATATFSRNSVVAPGSVTLTVRTKSSTTRGTFTLKITAKSGSLSHQTNATLTVT
jgi:uncharacterized membrane protein